MCFPQRLAWTQPPPPYPSDLLPAAVCERERRPEASAGLLWNTWHWRGFRKSHDTSVVMKTRGPWGGGGQRLSLSSCRKVWEVKVKEVNDLLVAPGWTGLHAGTVGVQSGVPLQKRRKASSLHHRLTTTMMDKVRKQKIKKSICLTFKEFLYKLCQ